MEMFFPPSPDLTILLTEQWPEGRVLPSLWKIDRVDLHPDVHLESMNSLVNAINASDFFTGTSNRLFARTVIPNHLDIAQGSYRDNISNMKSGRLRLSPLLVFLVLIAELDSQIENAA